MNLSMTGSLADRFTSGAQRARVVTESWGESNLYCPNCSSPKLFRLRNNTKASDYSCPACGFWYQLKGQQSRIGSSIMDGAFDAMMDAIKRDETPSFYFLQYELATWRVKNLLLIPSFAFPPSAIIKRKPLSSTARRAGWVGCNFVLNRIPADARIAVVTESRVTPEAEVRKQFRHVKPLKDIPIQMRGWTLDVLNAIRRLGKTEFTTTDAYIFERELEQLHPDNRNIKAKIRQQLQELRDRNLLLHIGRNCWRLP
ncbi:MAG: DpnI domain-containing protein [Verrucomicrobiota bacterium]|jgi:type II restriction enzyme